MPQLARGVPQTFKEIFEARKITEDEIQKCLKLVLTNLQIQIITTANSVSRFCANLGKGDEMW